MVLHIGEREMAGVVRDAVTTSIKVFGWAVYDDVTKQPGADVGAGGLIGGERDVIDFVDDEVRVDVGGGCDSGAGGKVRMAVRRVRSGPDVVVGRCDGERMP